MEKAAYLDAMGIARWREAGKSAPLSPELVQALKKMLEHPLFAELTFTELNCQGAEASILLTPATGDAVSVPIEALDTAQGKRALWRALGRCGVL